MTVCFWARAGLPPGEAARDDRDCARPRGQTDDRRGRRSKRGSAEKNRRRRREKLLDALLLLTPRPRSAGKNAPFIHRDIGSDLIAIRSAAPEPRPPSQASARVFWPGRGSWRNWRTLLRRGQRPSAEPARAPLLRSRSTIFYWAAVAESRRADLARPNHWLANSRLPPPPGARLVQRSTEAMSPAACACRSGFPIATFTGWNAVKDKTKALRLVRNFRSPYPGAAREAKRRSAPVAAGRYGSPPISSAPRSVPTGW